MKFQKVKIVWKILGRKIETLLNQQILLILLKALS
jgi:hypothetical protein